MKLYDLLKIKGCIDTYDTEYDAIVTVDLIDYENDKDEFIYQWINEIHAYCAGYTSENVYKAFLDTITTHEQLIEQTEKDIDICE